MEQMENRREAFRLQDRVSLSVTILDQDKVQEAFNHFEKKRSDFGLMTHLKYGAEKYLPEMRTIERRHPEIATYLKFLEKQIEYVSAHISVSEQSEEAMRNQQVDLSANGIRFKTSLPVDTGDCLEMVLVLHPDESRLLVLAEVKRVEQMAPGKWLVSAEFVQLHEEDQEALIKHVHKKQIEELRRVQSDRD